MSFPAKPNPNNTLPNGVKLTNTSFGQKQDQSYNMPQIENQVTTHHSGKPRGGWDDDDEPNPFGIKNNKTTTQTNNTPKPFLSVNTGPNFVKNPTKPVERQEPGKKLEVLPCDEAFFNTHAYESKMISELVQPGGARLRLSDNVLNDFCRACESLQVEIVGSILINNLNAPIIWVSKARSIFAIEALVKKLKKFYEYFRYNLKVLSSQDFSQEGPNASQLKKAMSDLVSFIEDPTKSTQVAPQQVTTPASVTVKQISSPIHVQNPQTPVRLEGNSNPNPPQPQVQAQAQAQAKPNPFAFLNNKQPTTGPTQTQQTHKFQSVPPSPATMETPKQEPFTAPVQTQPKPNPFGITTTNNNAPSSANVKPSSGLPGAFKNKITTKASEIPQKGPASISSHEETRSTNSTKLTQTSSNNLANTQSPNHNQSLSNNLASTQSPQHNQSPSNNPPFPQKQNKPEDPVNPIMSSLSGLNFSDPAPETHPNLSEMYNAYPNPQYMQPPGPMYDPNMPHPPVYDPNVMGYSGSGPYNYPPPPGPYNYPDPQYNPGVNHAYPPQFYPPPQYDPHFQGHPQYPQYHPYPNYPPPQYPMQGYPGPMGHPEPHQGHPMQGGVENQQGNNKASEQPNQGENVEKPKEVPKKVELTPEEIQRRKQQEENEKKFESLYKF